MKKIYYLSTCSTCKRIMGEIPNLDAFEQQDIKTEAITPDQLDAMQAVAGSYEALFSRRAMKFRAQSLHEQTLTEADYRRLILEEYTFLKRPVIWVDDQLFVGSTKKTVAALLAALA